jgi:hypothetical protein
MVFSLENSRASAQKGSCKNNTSSCLDTQARQATNCWNLAVLGELNLLLEVDLVDGVSYDEPRHRPGSRFRARQMILGLSRLDCDSIGKYLGVVIAAPSKSNWTSMRSLHEHNIDGNSPSLILSASTGVSLDALTYPALIRFSNVRYTQSCSSLSDRRRSANCPLTPL